MKNKLEIAKRIDELESDIRDWEYNIQENQKELEAMYAELDELKKQEFEGQQHENN